MSLRVERLTAERARRPSRSHDFLGPLGERKGSSWVEAHADHIQVQIVLILVFVFEWVGFRILVLARARPPA